MLIGHDRAERIVNRRYQYHGFDEILGEHHFQRVERYAGAGMRWNLQRLESEHFDRVKNSPSTLAIRSRPCHPIE